MTMYPPDPPGQPTMTSFPVPAPTPLPPALAETGGTANVAGWGLLLLAAGVVLVWAARRWRES